MCHVRLSLVSQSVQQYVDPETKACLLLRCDAASLGKLNEKATNKCTVLTYSTFYSAFPRHVSA
jgi:hypothetical protein